MVQEEEMSPNRPVQQSPVKDDKTMDLGGILVYDAYARIEGSEKLTEYYLSTQSQRMIDPYILFSKEQCEQATQ